MKNIDEQIQILINMKFILKLELNSNYGLNPSYNTNKMNYVLDKMNMCREEIKSLKLKKSRFVKLERILNEK